VWSSRRRKARRAAQSREGANAGLPEESWFSALEGAADAAAGETGGASVRRGAGVPRSGGGRLEALPAPPASRIRASLRPAAATIAGSSWRCTLGRACVTTSMPRP